MNTCCSEINFLLELPHDNILDMPNIFIFCKILAKNKNKLRIARTKIKITSKQKMETQGSYSLFMLVSIFAVPYFR